MAVFVKTRAVLRATSHHVPAALGTASPQCRESSDMTSMKRGTGGRSSFSGNVITVFGCTGFLGRFVVNQLGKTGSQVICGYRGEPYFAKDLKLAGDLGQILFYPFSINDDASLRKAMKYSNVVINMIGREYKTRNFSLNDVHTKGARNIARAARECGVEKLIHFSAINASPNPQSIYMKGGSEFLKSKYAGEIAVREEFPDAIVMRPADIYGVDDRYFNYYASQWRRHLSMMPLWKRGEATIKMPVFASDVAKGVLQVVNSNDAAGQTFECVGPHSYYLSELIDYYYRIMRFDNFNRFWITPDFRLKVLMDSVRPTGPILHAERLELEHISDVLTDCPTLADLGVELTPVENLAPYILKRFRRFAYIDDDVGQYPDPEPPQVYA